MQHEPITYALAGVTPGWEDLELMDLASGDFMRGVIEANTVEGWVLRQKRGSDGRPYIDLRTMEIATERVRGRFAIIRRPEGMRRRR